MVLVQNFNICHAVCRLGYTEDGEQYFESAVFKLLAKGTFCDPRYKLDYLEDSVSEVIHQEVLNDVEALTSESGS